VNADRRRAAGVARMEEQLKYAVNIFLLRPQQVIDVALQAEKLGYDAIWVGEHVVTPVQNASHFPYAGDADEMHSNFNANIPFYDSPSLLGYLAAITKTVKMGTSVSIIPVHDPFHLARSVATLDIFSQGRFRLGIGTGWLKEEFDILGVDFASRGKRTDETLDIMVSLFNDEVTTYDGEIFKVPPIGLNPKPITRPHPPFVVGGHAPAALRRAARRGDAWMAASLRPAEIAPMIAKIKEMRAEAGRDGLPFEVMNGVQNLHDFGPDMVKAYEDAGVDTLVVSPWTRGSLAAEGMAQFAEAYFT
jgi:probable F420-dependent oxidoreductase